MPPSTAETPTMSPVRRLNRRERRVWNDVLAQFSHLDAGDGEQLTLYCEAAARYEAAAKELKRHPTMRVPVVNRASGNVTGHKEQRNPAAVTMKEALAQMTTLARRLLIDTASAAKRGRLLTAKARATRASEQAEAAEQQFAEEEVRSELDRMANLGYFSRNDPAVNRGIALDTLRIRRDIRDVQTDCPELFA